MPIVAIKELRAALPPKSRILGVDHGEKTLGLALSTPDLSFATPYKTLKRTTFTENLRELAHLCAEYHVRAFVIGLPLNMDGSAGPRVESVRSFAANLIKARDQLGFDPLIAFQDERLSTYAVEQFLIEERNMRRDKRKAVIDAHAAAHILQAALDGIKK